MFNWIASKFVGNKPRFSHKAKPATWSTLVFLAWENLASRKLRSALTIIGVLVGIGSIVFLLSLGLGLQNLVTKQVIGAEAIKTIDVTSPKVETVHLDQTALNKVKGFSNVADVGTVYAFAGKATIKAATTDTIVYGGDNQYISLNNFQYVAGTAHNADDPRQAIINTSALKAMGYSDTNKALGQSLRLVINATSAEDGSKKEIDETVKIVGVVSTGNGTEVYVSPRIYSDNVVANYSQIKIVAANLAAIKSLRSQIESLGFITNSPIDTLDQINQLFRYFNIILAGIGGIGMIIAILGMFNTLTISLLERTQEVGLMITLGAQRKTVRRLFVIEALLLSYLGGILGILLAGIGGRVIDFFMNSMARGRGVKEAFSMFSMPWWLILTVLTFMGVVALIVVAYPARRAGRINPIDALRHE